MYARVSSKDQERDGFSIPAQRKILNEYALAKALTVVREFKEAETAKEAGRSAFMEMVAFLKATPSCRIILVEKTDRLYRNFRDLLTVEDLGVAVHFVKENTVLSADSEVVREVDARPQGRDCANLGRQPERRRHSGIREKAVQGHFRGGAHVDT